MIGDIIGAIGSLAGGLISSKASEKQQAQNIAMQREFAQNGVRWKVADAKAAGVHPLFALGASTHSFTPQSVGDSMGDAVAQAGQNIGRAAQSAMTAGEREKAAALDALTLEKAGLENELLRTQIGQLKQSQVGPAMPDGSRGLAGEQGDVRKYSLAHGIPIHAVGADTPAQKMEDEYGDESIINWINNNYRQFRDLVETGRAQNIKHWGGLSLFEQARQYLSRLPKNPRSRRDRVRWH